MSGTTMALTRIGDLVMTSLIEVEKEDLYKPVRVVFHPSDWQRLAIEKDLNGQYFLHPSVSITDGMKMVMMLFWLPTSQDISQPPGSARLEFEQGKPISINLTGANEESRPPPPQVTTGSMPDRIILPDRNDGVDGRSRWT